MRAISPSQNLCPRCKNPLRLLIESESKNRTTTISYVYVCNVCKYKSLAEKVVLKLDSDKILVIKSGTVSKLS